MTTLSLCLLVGLFISCVLNIYQFLHYEKIADLYDYEYENNQRLLHEIQTLNKNFSMISGKIAVFELEKKQHDNRSHEDNINKRWP